MNPYVPKVGDSVCARRNVHSNIYTNKVIGPVVETWDNACQITVNAGTERETTFRFYYNDWNFQFLFKTED